MGAVICILSPKLDWIGLQPERKARTTPESPHYYLKVLRAAHKRALGQEKEKEEAMKELPEYLKLLEHELKGKDFFGGDAIGYVDIVGHVIAFWLGAVKEVTGVEWFTEEEYPSLWKWRERFQENDAANQCRPPREKHHEYIRARLEASQSASK